MQVKITYLVDHKEYKPEIIKWLMAHWGEFYPERSAADWEKHLFLNKDILPLTLIAIDESAEEKNVVGVVSLKYGGMPSYPKESVWLTGLFVEKNNRQHGIASFLLRHALNEAKKFNVGDLFLFTRTNGHIYKKLGWQVIATPEYQGGEVLVMSKKVDKKHEYIFSASRNIFFKRNRDFGPSLDEKDEANPAAYCSLKVAKL